MQTPGLHEDLSRAHDAAVGSERNFGFTIAAALAVLGALSWHRAGTAWPWLLAVAAIFAITATAAPGMLGPLNRIWFRFGQLLSRIAQPLILGLMFYAIFTPFALLRRRFSRVPLGMGPESGDTSYWIVRPAERRKDDLRNQF